METSIKKNAALLTGLMLVKKILSIAYKIPYQNRLGDAGFYVFQQVYPFIGLLMVLTGFAMPTVIGSLLVENNYVPVLKDKLKRSMWIFSLVVFAILFLGNRQIAQIMGDIRLAPVIRVAGIHFLSLPLIAYLRGVLQSRPDTIGKMGYSIIIEQVTRVFAILAVIFLVDLDPTVNSYYRIAELAFMVSLISPVITLIYLYWLQPVDDAQTFRIVTTKYNFSQRTLFLALSSGILIIFNMIDSFLVFNTLITSQPQAGSMLSTGVLERGLPIIQAGTFFVSSLVALSMSQFEKSKTIKAKRLSFIVGIFSIMGLAVPGTVGLIQLMPIFNRLLFGNQLGTSTLQILVLQVILYSAVVLLTATLSREKKQSYVQASFLVGILAKIILTVPLVSRFSIAGAAISSGLSLSIMLVIMLRGARHLITTRLVATLSGIGIATFIMWLGLRYFQPLLMNLYTGYRSGDFLIVIITAIIGAVIYGLIMIIFIGLFKVMRHMFRTEQERRQEQIEKLEKQRRRHQMRKQQEELRLQEAEIARQRRIESLMQNKPKQPSPNVISMADHNAGQGHWQQSVQPEPFYEEKQEEEYFQNERNEPRMRLDKFLKVSRIIKRRQTAKEVSDAGKIAVNGKIAKSSTTLFVGDEIALYYATRTLVVRVLALLDSTKKEDADRMFEVVSETPRNEK